MYDLIVVGGGPAGLTATIYALRKRLNVLLVTKDLGGMTNYRLAVPWKEETGQTGFDVIRGLEVIGKFRNELEYLDFARHMEQVETITKTETGFMVTTQGGAALPAKAIIVATGARQQRLRVPGEKEYMMRGLGYSALSYAPLFFDRTAAVVGDGDLALRSAAELATIARQVYLVAAAGQEELLARPLGQKLQQATNVTLLPGCEVIEVSGDEYARCLAVRDSKAEVSELEVDGIFVEMGLLPNTQMVADLVELDAQGRIVIDSANRTSQPGLFAAGDVTSGHAEQVLIAVGEGAKAALSAYEFLLTGG